jgi:hypothetical protein
MNNSGFEPSNKSTTPDFQAGSRFRHRYIPANDDYEGRSNKMGTVEMQRTQGYTPGGEIWYAVKFDDETYATSLSQSSMMPPSLPYRPKKSGGGSKRRVKSKRRTLRRRV